MYVISFIDRQIIGILSPFIKNEMGLTDAQLGWLKGLAFALLYSIVGIPIAWLADRYSRKKIITVSLIAWSGFTALTGMAGSFYADVPCKNRGGNRRGRGFTAVTLYYIRPLP